MHTQANRPDAQKTRLTRQSADARVQSQGGQLHFLPDLRIIDAESRQHI